MQTHNNIKLNDYLYQIIELNPFILLVFEHLQLFDVKKNQTIKSFCKEKKLNESLILSIFNIYNGNSKINTLENCKECLPIIVKFLKHSHFYYKNEKYPLINQLLNELAQKSKAKEIKLLKKFFEAYINEVNEHLDYEEKNVFPYVEKLYSDKKSENYTFSIKQYQEHHNDIEEKLSDLKNLLIHHLKVGEFASLNRQIIFHLHELEFDLHAHSIIEDKILVPIISSIEKNK